MIKLIEAYISESRTEQRVIRNNLLILLLHMLKCKYQNEYTHKSSWRKSIYNAFDAIVGEFKGIGKGSLYNSYYRRKLDLNQIYRTARINAIEETGKLESDFPVECEWTKEQLTDINFIDAFINTWGKDSI